MMMVSDDSPIVDLTLRAVGPATEGGRLPLAELSRLTSGLQAALELLALGIAGKAAGPGRRPREIVDAVRLDFVGFRAGSAVLDIARTGQLSLDEGLLDQALTALEEGTNSLRERPDVLPPYFGPQVLNQLRSLTGGISARNVTRVELWQKDRARFVIDEALQRAVRRTSFEKIAQESTVVGRLHMGDFSPATLRCRIDTYAGSILCDFDSDLRDAVLDAMDEVVMAEGVAELEPNGATIHILHLSSLRRIDSVTPKSLADLARAQGVGPVRSIDELRGLPVGEMDDFLAALRSARGEDEDA
ncbi:hypothetical protein ACFOX0_10200 [Micromonospora zhanjiangensis]|uniref:Uncharacterized protein n=1 Tax=Micromonospora zhanjiangensis TaxID=1522057 RepID=A0ABV8KJN3_9ACTN